MISFVFKNITIDKVKFILKPFDYICLSGFIIMNILHIFCNFQCPSSLKLLFLLFNYVKYRRGEESFKFLCFHTRTEGEGSKTTEI